MIQADLERNKAVVLDFYDRFFNKGDADALDQLLAENYIQHNPGAPDGRDAIKPKSSALSQRVIWWLPMFTTQS
jgi:predicted SnoaL-like aldol condensation-catalyzing enzyme